MKQTRTTLKELTAMYRAVLRHGILCNAIALGLIATVTPAMAEVSSDRQLITDDSTIVWTGDNVSDINYVANVGRPDGNIFYGGRVFVDRGSKLTIGSSSYENITFDGNGAAAATRTPRYGKSAVLEINGTTFTNNHARENGGAVASYNELSISGSTFTGNTALLEQDGEGKYTVAVTTGMDDAPMGGGAIGLGAESTSNIISIETTNFINNKSGLNGGAIATRLAKDADNSAAKLDIEATFTGNEALQSGGALYNTFYTNNGLDKGDGVTVTGTFTNNKAGVDGGAIYNDGAVDKASNAGGVMTLTDSTFIGNAADNAGGAIYNSGALTVTGESAFTNNFTTTSSGGAIYNSGALTLTGTELNKVAFTGNHTTKSGTNGGAIFAATGGSLDIDYAKFENNTATNGGAITNLGTSALTIDNSIFTGNTVATNGGAIQNNATVDAEISNTTFSGNYTGKSSTSASGSGSGGAIYNGSGKLTLTNNTFTGNGKLVDGNTETMKTGTGGAIYNNSGTLEISGGSIADNMANKAGAIYVSSGSLSIDGTEITGNASTGGSGVIWVNGGNGFTINNATIDNNSGIKNDAPIYVVEGLDLVPAGTGAVGNGGAIYNNSAIGKTSTITGGSISQNVAATGGAIYNNRGILDINGTTFNGNVASGVSVNSSVIGGGAIRNLDTLNIKDATFTNNIAKQKGGAIFTAASKTITFDGSNKFSGNKSDVTWDENGNITASTANDIYNNMGTINIISGAGETNTFAGGFDGVAGSKLNINGAGTTNIANALKNHTTTVNSGELHLNNVDLTGSSVAVNSHAVLNSQDGAINNYSSNITLNHDAELLVDANDSGVDSFSIADGATVTLNGLKMLSDLTADSRTFALADSGTIDVGGALVFTSNHKYNLTGSNDGHLTIAKGGLGGLSAAVNATTAENYQGIVYSVTGNDGTVDADAEIKKADITILGNGGNTVTLGAALTVGDDSSLVFNGATVEGTGSIESTENGAVGINDSTIAVNINNDGMMGIEDSTIASGKTIENRAGALLQILDSNINSRIVNAGTLISDPTHYGAEVVNTGSASFEGDTFEAGSSLTNSAIVNLSDTQFLAGSTLTGLAGNVLNIAGTGNVFAGTSTGNNVKLASGANYTGTLSNGVVDARNGGIDTITGAVSGGDLYVDASLKGAGSIDTFTGTTGSTIKSINVTSTEYGSADSISMNVGGATLDENLQVTGAMNYYTKVEKDGDNLVFSDKLINKSTLDTTLADYATSDDLTTGLAGKADVATTLAGYGITDAYTKDEVDTALAGKATTTALTGVSDRVTTLENAGYQTASDVSTAISGATIAQSQVTGLSDALAGKATTTALTGVSDRVTTLENAGYQTASDVSTAISGATIAQSQVTGLSDALAGKATTTALAGVSDRVTTLENAGYQTASDVSTAITAALTNAGGQGGAYQTASAVETKIADTAAAATYDNSSSGLAATTLQGAIDETASTVATINTNMGKVHGLVSSENGAKTLHETDNGTTSANVVSGEYKGNLAVGTTVEDHLIALDNAIGTMSALDTTNGVLSNTASVATNLQNLDTAAASNAQNIQKIVDGTTTVAKATTATNATNAVNATNDGQGRNIASTYATLQLVNDTVGDMSTVSGTYVSNTASVATNLNQLSAAIDSIAANSVAGANAYTDQRVEALDKDLSAGVAGAVALSSVAVSGVERGEVSVGAGYGYFNGQSAAAFGAAMGLSNRWSVNAGAGISNSDVSFRAGTNYKFKLF